jgi:hypothetical protein
MQAKALRTAFEVSQAYVLTAVQVSAELMEDPDSRVKLAAAKQVMSFGMRVYENQAISNRMQILEDAYELARRRL